MYFRLKVVQIRLAASRERKVDIPALVAHFLLKFSDPQQPVRAISDGTLRRLMAHHWPGDVRELENVVECAVALSSGRVLTADDLPSINGRAWLSNAADKNEVVPLAEIERRAVFHALHKTGGNKFTAAQLLGIGKTTLYRKLQGYTAGPHPNH